MSVSGGFSSAASLLADNLSSRRLSAGQLTTPALVSQSPPRAQPPPKPAKSDRVTAFAESLLRSKEASTRASIRQLQGQRKVARLTQAYDNLGESGGCGIAKKNRWRSEENLCLSGGNHRQRGEGNASRSSVIDEDPNEELENERGPELQRSNHDSELLDSALEQLKKKPRAATTLGPSSGPQPKIAINRPSPTGGRGAVMERIRELESRGGSQNVAPPRSPTALQPPQSPTKQNQQQQQQQQQQQKQAQQTYRHTVFAASEDYVYEDLRSGGGSIGGGGSLSMGAQQQPRRILSPADENVYDIGGGGRRAGDAAGGFGDGGFGIRRTASVDDLISSSPSAFTASSSIGIGVAAESEYAVVVVRSDRAVPASVAHADPPPGSGGEGVVGGGGIESGGGGVEVWRTRVLERVADAFSAFRKLSAYGYHGSNQYQRAAAASPALSPLATVAHGGESDLDDGDDDDGSRSNVSEEVADRIRRAELTKQQNEAVLRSGLQAKRMRHDQLFSGCCLIRYDLAPPVSDMTSVPATSFCHPAAFAARDFSFVLPSFCFPDADSLLQRARHREHLRAYLDENDRFSFVLTEQRGERNYGYCMRRLIENPGTGSANASSVRGRQTSFAAGVLVEALCIVTPVESEQLYYQILLEAFRKRQIAPSPERGLLEVEEFMVSVYNRPLPNAGSWFDLTTTDPSRAGLVVSCRFQRPASGRLQHVSYAPLLTFPGVQNTLLLFGAVLHERKVILVSSNPRRLSQCAQALAALLYPLRWQHTLVPIVPANMLRIVCSPTPYIVGVLEHHLAEVLQDDLDDDVLIVHLDEGRFLRQKGDEKKLLTRKLQRALFRSLDGNRQLESRYGGHGQKMRVSELLIVETFLKFFAIAIGHYAEHVVSTATVEGVKKRFDREAFCSAPRSKGLRALLKVLTATGNFHVFISDVLDGSAYEANKLTVSTVLRDFDTAVRTFQDDVDRHGGGGGGGIGGSATGVNSGVVIGNSGGSGGGIFDGFRSKMKKLFTGSGHHAGRGSNGGGGTLSSSYALKSGFGGSVQNISSSHGGSSKPALPPRR